MYASFEYKKSERDAYLVNVHGDHAELLKVNPQKGVSQYFLLSAEINEIREYVSSVVKVKGYKLCNYIDLSLRGLTV
jgi:hypothetical protein